MRSGVIAQKVGMTRVYNDAGEHIPVTVLRMENCQVVAHRTEDKNGYTAVQLGAGQAKVKNTSKPLRGQFAAANVEPKAKVAEFRVSSDNLIDVGAETHCKPFRRGPAGRCYRYLAGKGFAGAMKRHNFGGLRATHGVSVSHRSHGSTGSNQDPGRVWKGKRMAGHMGQTRITTQNLEVVSTDEDRGLILVKGAVPGSKGAWIVVRDAIKSGTPADAPRPAAVRAAK